MRADEDSGEDSGPVAPSPLNLAFTSTKSPPLSALHFTVPPAEECQLPLKGSPPPSLLLNHLVQETHDK